MFYFMVTRPAGGLYNEGVAKEPNMSTVDPSSQIPQELLTKLNTWYEMTQRIAELKPLIEAENALRKELVQDLFPDTVEGTASPALPDGYTAKGTKKLDRKIDESALPAVQAKFREMGLNPDPIVTFKPSLATTVYKSLTEEQKAVFDEALIIKPSTPTLEIVAPKHPKG